MRDGPPISRGEVFGGLSARRAATVLFTIESRVAHLARRFRQAVGNGLEQQTAESQERTFLAAVAAGRNQLGSPRMQDLERFAPDVTPLVPPDAAVRAEIANRLAEQHAFRAEDVPRLRAVLALDDDEVATAFERHFGRPIDAIYARELSRSERWRWARAGRTTPSSGAGPPTPRCRTG